MSETAVAGRGPAREALGRGAGGTRLTVRGRRLVLVTALALVGVLGMVGGRATAAPREEPPAAVEVPVRAGDTLWAFAAELAGPGEDVRDVVAAIQRLNGMTSAALRAGETILLPAAP